MLGTLDTLIPDYICKNIIESSLDKLTPSVNYDGVVSQHKTCYSTWLKTDECILATNLIAEEVGEDVSHFLTCNILRYTKGQHFAPHFDATPNDGGIRLKTFMLYLNDDYTGGETHFPNVGATLTPKTGKIVWWQNYDDNNKMILASMHESLPVKTGTKFVAVISLMSKNE